MVRSVSMADSKGGHFVPSNEVSEWRGFICYVHQMSTKRNSLYPQNKVHEWRLIMWKQLAKKAMWGVVIMWLIFSQLNLHNRYPILRPWGWDKRCLLWVWTFINVPHQSLKNSMPYDIDNVGKTQSLRFVRKDFDPLHHLKNYEKYFFFSYTLSREYRVARNRYSRLLFTGEDRFCANLHVQQQLTNMTSQCQCRTFVWSHRSTVVTSQY